MASDDCSTPAGAEKALGGVDAVCVPGGFGVRGIEGKLGALTWARESGTPTLGLCLGLQCMVIEAARNLAGLPEANSLEFDESTPDPVVATMADQVDVVSGERDMGGTMRLGLYPAELRRGQRRGRGLRRRRTSTSATGTATRSTTPTATQLAEAGPGLLRHLAGRPARGVRRAARARCTPTTWAPRRTRSSGRGRPAGTRCSWG